MKAKIETNDGCRPQDDPERFRNDYAAAQLDQALTNRGFLLGCALIAEAIEWAKFKEGIEDVEGLTTTFQRVCKVFREY